MVGQRVLWVKASRGRDVLPQQLRAAGADLDELPVYQNIDATEFSPQVIELLKSGHLDWIGLSSPSGARSLARLLPAEARTHLEQSLRLAAISPVTAEAASEAGLPSVPQPRNTRGTDCSTQLQQLVEVREMPLRGHGFE